MFALFPWRRAAFGWIFSLLLNASSGQPAPDPIEGTWTGTVTAPQGRAEIGFAFARGTDGRLTLAFHMPAMFTYNAKLGAAVKAEGSTYTLLPFNTRLQLEGDRLTGTFGLSPSRSGPARCHRPGHPPSRTTA
jgi:hypothetical protein